MNLKQLKLMNERTLAIYSYKSSLISISIDSQLEPHSKYTYSIPHIQLGDQKKTAKETREERIKIKIKNIYIEQSNG